MISSRAFVSAAGCLLGALLLVGCGGDDSDASSDWTVEEGALTLEQDLLVSDTDSFYFGGIADVAPASDGRMFVADAEAIHIKVLGADGRLRRTLGREGEGPGEFERPGDLVVSRGDSLYVLDGGQRRVSVFAPDGEFAYVVDVSPPDSGPVFPDRLLVPRDQSGFVLKYFSGPFGTDSNRGSDVVQRVSVGGTSGDTVLVATRHPMHHVDRSNAQLYIPIPFMPSLHHALGPDDRIHFARGDSLSVVPYALDGTPQDTVSVPFEPMPVTEEDKDRVLEDFSKERPMPRNKIPSTKPAFEDFLVDDEGRYWFGRPTAHPDTTEWWLADPDGQHVATTRLATDIDLLAVRDGFAYGETNTEAGAPAVVRYRIRISQ